MKERPILFRGPMVKAILEGRKTMTRRVVKYPCGIYESSPAHNWEMVPSPAACPYGAVGDRLWVRERLRSEQCGLIFQHRAVYCADGAPVNNPGFDGVAWEWDRLTLPSIHMPRWASRLTLEIVAIRVERLQEISEADAKAEGCELLLCDRPYCYSDCVTGGICKTACATFADLWDSINGKKHPWDSNPWVFVIEFKVVTQ